jgi:monofunctional biosynthetic peptidoglycan transglycosylase
MVILIIVYQLWIFVRVIYYSFQPPGPTAVMRGELIRLRAQDPKAILRHKWIDYDRISTSLKQAVVASEDANFLNHGGIEWNALRQAWQYNQSQAEQGRTRMRGGSTISQQLAKNLFLSDARTYLRKGQEMVITYMIEHVMSKERILELYLNVAEWGEGVFGIEAAAQHYYRTSAANLSAAQSARLAVMLPNPRFYGARGLTGYLSSRSARVQRWMHAVTIP